MVPAQRRVARTPQKADDGLTKSQRYYIRHRDKILEKKRALRQKTTEAPLDNPISRSNSRSSKSTIDERTDKEIQRSYSYSPQDDSDDLEDLDSDGTSNVDNEANDAYEIPELARFTKINRAALGWSALWGGIDSWSVSLEEEWSELLKTGDQIAMQEWTAHVWQHAQNGRQLLAELTQIDGAFPPNDTVLRELMRNELRIASILTRGITILDIRAGLVTDGAHISATVEYDSALESPLE